MDDGWMSDRMLMQRGEYIYQGQSDLSFFLRALQILQMIPHLSMTNKITHLLPYL
jgi:hypothetical protein